MLDMAYAMLPALTGLLAFRRVFSGPWEFVYDDNHNFIDILELSHKQVKWYFTEAMVLGVYEPLSLTLKALFVTFFGWDPTAFHLLAVALHIVNATLAFFLGQSLLSLLRPVQVRFGAFGSAVGCAIGASLFACHPGAVQTVCWVSCLPYLFAALFSLMSLISLLKALRHAPSNSCAGKAASLCWRVVSMVQAVAAMLCKAAAIPLVVVLCAVEFAWLSRDCTESSAVRRASSWCRNMLPCRAVHSMLRQCVPLLVSAALLWKGTSGYHLEELVKLSSRETFLRACFLLVLYPGKVADPGHDFNVMQALPYDGINGVITECWLCAGLVTAGALWAARATLFTLDTSPARSAASPASGAMAWLLACYAALIAPGLGLHEHTADQLYADRYLYVPAALLLPPAAGLLGQLAASAWAASGPAGPASRVPLAALLAGLLGTAAAAYHVRRSGDSLDHWRSNQALWAHATQVQPWNHRWWYHYAQELADSSWPLQEPDLRRQALEALEKSMELRPAVYTSIAKSEHLHELGRFHDAVNAWEAALQHHSSDFERHSSGNLIQLPSEKYRILCGLGRARLHTRDFDGAKSALSECLRLYPKQVAAVCTRRQAHAHVYAARPALPPGVWWHQAPGERGKPGVLCSMPACTQGCLLYHQALAHFELREWKEAAAASQQAYDHRYAPAQGFLVWGAALYHLGDHANARTVWQAGLAAKPQPTPQEEAQLRGNLLALDRAHAEARAPGDGNVQRSHSQSAEEQSRSGGTHRNSQKGKSGKGKQ